MYVDQLYRRLAEMARDRIHAGAFTEARLARMCGLSQPHLHHLLRGKRAFSMKSAEMLMRALGLTVAEVLWSYPESEVRMVPTVRGRIGPGAHAVLTATHGFEPFGGYLVDRLIDPLVARVASDPLLPPFLHANDLILLDQNPFLRDRPAGGCWVVLLKEGLRIRYVKLEEGRLLAGNDPGEWRPRRWLTIPLAGREVREIVRAQVVWLGRKITAEAAGPDDKAR